MTIFVVPLFVLAQTPNPNPTGTPNPPARVDPVKMNIEIKNPFNCGQKNAEDCTIPDLIKVIVNKILIPIGGVVAVVMIIWAGFLYVTAGGNDSQIKKAREALLWGVIGAAILLGAWVITNAIQATIKQLESS